MNQGLAALADLFEAEGRRIARTAYGLQGINRADIATAADCFAVAAGFRAASGMEAATAGETTKIGSTEGDSPTAESGDAQTPPGSDQ